MTVIIVPIDQQDRNCYRFETIDGTVQGRPFHATTKPEFLAQLKAFRIDELKEAFSWNTPTSSITAALIASKPLR